MPGNSRAALVRCSQNAEQIAEHVGVLSVVRAAACAERRHNSDGDVVQVMLGPAVTGIASSCDFSTEAV
jgi:hypothetical protein